ncbi:hypothetical protein [Singulisphaera acidiphila]|uniref:Uncharacterized protein n=1 Tax=Singulisphaera acidiphila (strain ATCC BAA-1392 / DSM 18658 / VKM B-2454 / MOB10) TaxID=886293 RepID=L0DHY6_SINAD|nr:hypothetical protein [Singulisphaera acidiphila]AGA28418.1 hypothetical protein Sinac_4214 [Singulisphaera acidiphila DSM 18658]
MSGLQKSRATLPAWLQELQPPPVASQPAPELVAAREESSPSRLPWRPLLASWPVAWRERWGHRANSLESQGLGWRAAEEQAFAELLQAKREVEQSPPSRRIPSPERSLFFKESA